VGDDPRITPHDAAELAACFKAHAGRLSGFAFILAREDRTLTDDLIQATFEAAARAWDTLRGLSEDERRNWLCGSLATIAASGLRAQTTFGGRLVPVEALRHDAHPEPAFSAVALERCWQIIREMPPRQYSVTLLRWLLGMKEAEIAAVLGIAESTVSAQLHQARRKLIEQLGPDHPFARGDPEGASS
jgi:RNA polymerase sigma-70 factor (ECF subfamily)